MEDGYPFISPSTTPYTQHSICHQNTRYRLLFIASLRGQIRWGRTLRAWLSSSVYGIH